MIDIRSFRDVVRLFFIFKKPFIVAIAVTVIITVLGAFLLPAKYISDASLLVKQGRENSTLPIEADNRQALIAPSTVRDPVIDEEKMLISDEIVTQVADQMIVMMNNMPAPTGLWKKLKASVKHTIQSVVVVIRNFFVSIGLVDEKTELDRVKTKLLKNFSVTHDSGSAVMELAFVWDDPTVANKVLEFWVDAYLNTRTKTLSRSSRLYDFYDNARLDKAKEVESIRIKINEKLNKLGMSDFDQDMEALTDRINRTKEALSQAENNLEIEKAGLKQARALQSEIEPQIISSLETDLNPNKVDLQEKLNQLSLKRIELLKTYVETADPVIELDKGMGQLSQQIASEPDRVTHSEMKSLNEVKLTVDRDIVDKKMSIQQLQASVATYEKELTSLTKKMRLILSEVPVMNKLKAELDSAQSSYQLYMETYEKARIDRELDRESISNVVIVEPAAHNPSRVFPKSLQLLLLALPAGLFIGVFVVYLLSIFDRRIHDGGKAEKFFSVPLWSSVREATQEEMQSSAFKASIYRIYNLLPKERIAEQGIALGIASCHNREGVSFISEQLAVLLTQHDISIVSDPEKLEAGEVAIIEAANVSADADSLLNLEKADLILFVVEAGETTVPMLENGLAIVKTAFEKVDGLILNRRKYEIPASLLKFIS